MTTKTHRHSVATSKDRGFSSPVNAERENRAAHGNICRIDTCSCGAKRWTNINQQHTESSGWIAPESE